MSYNYVNIKKIMEYDRNSIKIWIQLTLTSEGRFRQNSWLGTISQPVAPRKNFKIIVPPIKYIPVNIKK